MKINGVVGLWDLPEKEVFVHLKSKMHKTFENKIREFGVFRFARKIGVSDRILLHWLSDGSSLRLDVLKMVLKAFNTDLKVIQKNIKFIRGRNGGNIISPKLHFDFSTISGARFIAAILGDGCLDKKYRIFYANTNIGLIEGFIEDATNIFGNVEYSMYRMSCNLRVMMVSLPPLCGKIVSKVGLARGRKVVNNQKIPDFIFNLTKDKKWEFLSQLFDDEGSVNLVSKHIKMNFAIEENHKTFHFVEGITRLFEDLGVEPAVYQRKKYGSVRGRDRVQKVIQINGSYQIKRINGSFNLRHLEKRRKLRGLINSFKVIQYRRKECSDIYISKMKSIEKEKCSFNSLDLARATGRAVGSCRNLLCSYRRRDIVKTVLPYYAGNIRRYAEYKVNSCKL